MKPAEAGAAVGESAPGAAFSPRQAWQLIGRLMLTAAVLAALLIAGADRLAQAYLPLLQWSLAQLDGDNRIVSLTLAAPRSASALAQEAAFLLETAPDKPVFIGGQLTTPNPQGRAQVSVLSAYLWQPLMLAIPLCMAWPSAVRGERRRRLLLLAPLLAAFALLDLPFVLWAQVWGLYVQAYQPDRFSPLLIWADMLQAGGRVLFGFLLAGLSVQLAGAGRRV